MLRTALSALLMFTAIIDVCGSDPKSKYSRAEYIAMWKDVAIEQMREHGIPASITLAQAILESGDGNSRLAKEANNHFGIKCHDWQGKKVYHDDDARNECFRKYKDARESFHDHSVFLQRSRYAFLFEYEITDYKRWAKGLKQAGYATNPRYPELLIRLIEENNLTAYDMQALNGKGSARSKKQSPPKHRNDPSGDEIIVDLQKDARVWISNNRIKYTLAEERETPESLAAKLNMGAWQLRRYNDLNKGETIKKGELVYLQPKRHRAAEKTIHVVQEGESLRDISQKYGVKQKKLLKRAGLPYDYVPKAGDKIQLR